MDNHKQYFVSIIALTKPRKNVVFIHKLFHFQNVDDLNVQVKVAAEFAKTAGEVVVENLSKFIDVSFS